MSSDMKDARWFLAIEMTEAMGYDYAMFPYPTWQKILDAAQAILDVYPDEVRGYAEAFRRDRD